MNKTFEEQWKIYKEGGKRPEFTGEKPRGDADFDSPVKVGEIRIFADMPRPFVALVAEDRGAAGYLIIPVSPFSVPASSREVLEDNRVYQLWNACTASRSFVSRSWLVDEVEGSTVDALVNPNTHNPSTQTPFTKIVSEYEREFLVSGGDFIPLVDKCEPKVVHVSWRKVWGIAACFVVLLGIGVVVLQDGGRPTAKDLTNVQSQTPAVTEKGQNKYFASGSFLPPVESKVGFKGEVMRCEEAVRVKARCAPMAAAKPVGLKKSFASMELETQSVDYGWSSAKAKTPAGTERYAEFQENDYRDPTSEPLSTFGLDVDTSSYTTMRRYIDEMKRIPPRESVRLEEYVNYFKYRYPQPKGDEPIAVACEMGVCPWAPKHKLLRVGVQAKEVAADKIPPCNLTFLIDVSGSMGWNGGFEMMKAGLNMLIDKLRPEDHVAIVTYASGTHVRLASTPGTEKAKIRAVVEALQSGGGTSGASGIQLAYEEAKKNFDKNANNRVVLITDGDFNVGISSPKGLEHFIAEKRDTGIFLTVLGVGMGNYQDANMKKLSTAGNGNYAYLDSVLEAKKVMMTEFGGTMLTVAKDVKLQLEFNPAEVKGYRLLGYESRRLAAKDFNDDKKDAGEIGAGHTMTAFYEIIPAGSDEKVGNVDPLKYQKRSESGSGEVCMVKLRWKKPDGDKSILKETPIVESEVTAKVPSEDFRFASSVAEFALLMSDSKHKGSASFGTILDRARHAKGEDFEGYRAEFIRLVEKAELMSKR